MVEKTGLKWIEWQTNNKEVAARLATPDTHFALEYVRPDFILIRVVAHNLILWDR